MKLSRLPKVVAVAWLVVAVGITVLIGPALGWRGWMWLAVHHTLCAFGAAWELWVRAEPGTVPGADPPSSDRLGSA